MAQKLWQKEIEVETRIEKFTVGDDAKLDMELAEHDVLGSLAHITMLESINLLDKEDLPPLKKELVAIYKRIQNGDFIIEDGVEDIHSQVELELTKKLGDIGKKIHSGRSRNDQVLVDLKLYMRAQLTTTIREVQVFFNRLIELSEKYKEVLIPGYTHLQIAMPSSFGLWFGAYAESLLDDLNLLKAAYDVVNKNPLGSAAGYGSSFPLNRTYTTELLGFETLNYNVVYAQMSRGKTEKVVSMALSSVASTLGRMAMDVCLYMNQNFGFLTFPDQLTTGSSIMPHKKNPDVFEIMRGKCNKLIALPNEISLLTGNLPSGYHREMQLIKENFFPAFTTLNECLDMAGFMFDHIIIKEGILSDDKYKYLYSVEIVNQMVLDGMPFRDAYKQVGMMIESGEYNPSGDVNHTHEGSIGNLCNDKIKEHFDKLYKSFPFDQVKDVTNKLIS